MKSWVTQAIKFSLPIFFPAGNFPSTSFSISADGSRLMSSNWVDDVAPSFRAAPAELKDGATLQSVSSYFVDTGLAIPLICGRIQSVLRIRNPREVGMRLLRTLTFFLLAVGLTYSPSVWAQQKPFTQEQVSNLVRDGLGDESGAKLIEQRGN